MLTKYCVRLEKWKGKQKSEKGDDYVKLVSYNEKHHPAKDVALKKIRAMAAVKASIRIN